METPKEYYYTYYSYEEWGRGYFGSRGCKCLPEEDVRYFGSFNDKTFRPTQKIILKDDYLTREEAYADEIILHDYYDVANNPHFANRAKATSTRFFYTFSKEEQIKNASKGGMKLKEIGMGIHALTPEQRSENSKKIGKKHKEFGTGIFSIKPEEKIEICKKAGIKTKNLSLGIHGLSKEEQIKNASKGGMKLKEIGMGIHALTPEQRSENSKKAASQKWMCLETGHISNAGGLTSYQRARGIDTSLRERIS
jgi:hypothetical protein